MPIPQQSSGHSHHSPSNLEGPATLGTLSLQTCRHRQQVPRWYGKYMENERQRKEALGGRGEGCKPITSPLTDYLL